MVRSRSAAHTPGSCQHPWKDTPATRLQRAQSLWPWHNQDSEYTVLALEIHPGSSQALITPITTPSNEGPSKTRDTSSTEALGLQPHPKGKHSRNLCLKATGLEQHSSRFLSIRAQNFCPAKETLSWTGGLGQGSGHWPLSPRVLSPLLGRNSYSPFLQGAPKWFLYSQRAKSKAS